MAQIKSKSLNVVLGKLDNNSLKSTMHKGLPLRLRLYQYLLTKRTLSVEEATLISQMAPSIRNLLQQFYARQVCAGIYEWFGLLSARNSAILESLELRAIIYSSLLEKATSLTLKETILLSRILSGTIG